MNQFAAKRYAQKLSIRYVSGPRNHSFSRFLIESGKSKWRRRDASVQQASSSLSGDLSWCALRKHCQQELQNIHLLVRLKTSYRTDYYHVREQQCRRNKDQHSHGRTRFLAPRPNRQKALRVERARSVVLEGPHVASIHRREDRQITGFPTFRAGCPALDFVFPQ